MAPILFHGNNLMLCSFVFQRLVSSKTGYLVGDKLSMADVGFLEPLLNTVEYLGIEILDGYPDIKVGT